MRYPGPLRWARKLRSRPAVGVRPGAAPDGVSAWFFVYLSHTKPPTKMQQEAVFTIWKDGTWRVWGEIDAEYAKSDPDYLTTISIRDIVDELAGPASLSPIRVLDRGFGDIDLVRIDSDSSADLDMRPVAFSVRNVRVAERMAYAWNLVFGKGEKPVGGRCVEWSN